MTTWIRVKTEEQLRAALESTIQFQCLIIDGACKTDLQAIRQETGADCKIYLQLPDVLRQKRKEQVRTLLQQAEGLDGLVIKNLDALGLILEEHAEQRFEIIADAFLYAYNRDALRFYRELIPDKPHQGRSSAGAPDSFPNQSKGVPYARSFRPSA